MKKIYKFLVILLMVSTFFGSSNMVFAQEVLPGFNPSKIVEDKVFADTKTFGGPEGIQKFLESKGSILANTSPEFLIKLKEPTIAILKEGLGDPRPNLGRLRTAAELIWDASQSGGLNPQVVLVTLNKEQSLITGHQNSSPEKLQKALDRSMGFDCPDATGCGNLFPGFYYQLFGNFDSNNNRYIGAVKSLSKSFNTNGGRGPSINGAAAKVGDTITLGNTLGAYTNIPSEQQVTILNKATAALYRYTPHVFNGNYNFWKFFTTWFRYANGTLIKLAGDANTYIIENGTRQLVPAFVAQARGLNLNDAVTASPNELEDYPADKVLGPLDETVVQISETGQKFVFLKNIKYPVSAFVLKQRGLDQKPVLSISSADGSFFDVATPLTPKDGTVVRGVKAPEIYLVENGKLKLFSSYTFKQRKVADKVQLVPDEEIATYAKQGFVPPVDGSLVKSDKEGTVYLIENGLRHPMSAEVFKNRGLSAKNIAVLSDDEVRGVAIGAYATPKEKTFFTIEKTGQLYIFKEGSKHPISSFVAKQRGITPDFTFSKGESSEWLDGIAIAPRDGTLIKGDKDGTVFLVSKGQLRPLTAKAFKARKYSNKNIKVISQDEVDGYAKGEVLAK
jgi:hypothetical protein